MTSITFSKWTLGCNNVLDDSDLPPDQLRRAVNVDVSDRGQLSRRRGKTLFYASIYNCHSMWDDENGNTYFVENGTLKKLNPDASTITVKTGLNVNDRVSFQEVNGLIYHTSISANGIINGTTWSPWGVELPAIPVTLSATVGSLDAGNYAAVVTYVDANGQESGASVQSYITTTSVGGITATLPIPVTAQVIMKRVYITTPSGEVMYRATEVPAATSSVVISAMPQGPECKTQFLIPMSYGKHITYSNGRIYVASGNVVWYTEPLNYGLMNPFTNYYQYGYPVDLIAGVEDGLYVCADKTYFIKNAGQVDAEPVYIYPFGAVPYTKTRYSVSDSDKVLWYTVRGAVYADDGAKTTLLNDKNVKPGLLLNAAAMMREQDGIRQYIVFGTRGAPSTLESASYTALEQLRRGT